MRGSSSHIYDCPYIQRDGYDVDHHSPVDPHHPRSPTPPRPGSGGVRGPAGRRRDSRCLRARGRGARGTDPCVGAGVRNPHNRSGDSSRAASTRHRFDHRRPDPRRGRGHRDFASGPGAALRQRSGDDRRRRHKTGQGPVPVRHGAASRELPKDAALHGRGCPGNPCEARRPSAQHAHARRTPTRRSPRRSSSAARSESARSSRCGARSRRPSRRLASQPR